MRAMDADLRRVAEDYVRRQCSYMAIAPSASEMSRAAFKVYRVLKDLRAAQRRHAMRGAMSYQPTLETIRQKVNTHIGGALGPLFAVDEMGLAVNTIDALLRDREADRAAISYLDKVLAVYHKHAGCVFTYPLGPVPECAACTAATIHAAAIQRAQDAKG